MSGSVNKVIIVGHVGKDPEIRVSQSGLSIANFSIATTERWKDKQTGDPQERTEWHRVVVFNEALVGLLQKYVKKGSKLYIEGQLVTRNYTDKQGVQKYTTEVVLRQYKGEIQLLDSAKDGPTQVEIIDDENDLPF